MAALLLAAPPLAAAEAESVAVLGVTLLDTSTEGEMFGAREDEAKRIDLVEQRLAERFAEAGYRVIDPAPVAEQLNDVRNIAQSNGVDAALARELGADLAVTGEVQKVSNLILTMNVFVRDAATGTLLRVGNADIRSNTDRSWTRGIDYVLKNRILAHGPIELP